jgi:hypothetical protein
MKHRPIPVGEGCHRGRRGEDDGFTGARAPGRGEPCFERKPVQPISDDEVAAPIGCNHDRVVGQLAVGSRPQDPIGGAREVAPASMALGAEAVIELGREEWRRGADGARHRRAVCIVVGAATGGAGSVACGQRDGIVEEEQRGPAPRTREREAPIAELGDARDPQRAAVVAHDTLVIIHDTATVAGEQATRCDGVEVAPWVHPVSARHATELRTCNQASA